MRCKLSLVLFIAVLFGLSSCDKVSLDDYYGEYNVEDDCAGNYIIEISESPVGGENVVITNFAGRDHNVDAMVDGKCISFEVDSYSYEWDMESNLFVLYDLVGNGSFNRGKIEFQYQLLASVNEATESCSSKAEKR